MAGEVQFGTITQSAMAFSQLLGAFAGRHAVRRDLVVRGGAFAARRVSQRGRGGRSRHCATLRIREADDRVAYEHVTLRGPATIAVLVDDLTATIGAARGLVRSADVRARGHRQRHRGHVGERQRVSTAAAASVRSRPAGASVRAAGDAALQVLLGKRRRHDGPDACRRRRPPRSRRLASTRSSARGGLTTRRTGATS